MASIAELILAQGQQRANARRQEGQIAGQTWQNLANIISQTGGQIQQQQADAPKRELLNLQLADAKRQSDSIQAFDTALKEPTNRNPDGSVNDDSVGKWLQGKNVGAYEHWMDISAKQRQAAANLQKTQQDIVASQASVEEKQQKSLQAKRDYLGRLAFNAEDMLGKNPTDPLHARDTTLASVARAAADGAISEQDAKGFLAQTASATPDQLRQTFGSFVPPELRSKLEGESADTAKKLAEAEKLRSEAERGPKGPNSQSENFLLDGKPVKGDYIPGASGGRYMFNGQDVTARVRPIPPVSETRGVDQGKLEQEYRTVLARGLSSRSGGLGLEDAKVQQANHLLAMLDQSYDPKAGTYNIPRVQQTELAMGLARLVSPGGTVGVEMEKEINQRTAKGDLAGLLTYMTGQPLNASSQSIYKMYRDSILRQGQVAQENREGEMRYLRGLAPTELEEARRQSLEANSLNPLRQSRVIQDDKTKERKVQVSTDGGKTWK